MREEFLASCAFDNQFEQAVAVDVGAVADIGGGLVVPVLHHDHDLLVLQGQIQQNMINL